jgi:hypothetical protein
MGYCAGYDQPGFATAPGFGSRGFAGGFGFGRKGRGVGRGLGRGFGRGMGYGPMRRGYYPPRYYGDEMPLSPENRSEMLREEIDAIDQQMEQLAKEKEYLERERKAAEGGE